MKSYVLVPAWALPATSRTAPEGSTTKYCVPAARLLVGSMVSAPPDTARRVLVAALKLSTTAPVAEPERISMVPVPRRMVSLKAMTRLLPNGTLVAPSVGEKDVTVGAVVSAGNETLETFSSATDFNSVVRPTKRINSKLLRRSVPRSLVTITHTSPSNRTMQSKKLLLI